ncbi:aspartic peptidase domain-containing protein [Pterulicium gracile]|uniref:Aspartic peptidase domain-containing protein n=1 Tax=Pterulicium gracile TaxID=1884261 RepID=A0A5C3QUG1_9AGAR|nr:aspartic peptidase domain-containing protein [Pterula gracilis]
MYRSYYTVIRAGDAQFRVSLDTASSDLWLISSNCTSDACSNIPKYPLSYGSPSFAAVNDNSTQFSLRYADGTVASGIVGRERVSIAGIDVASQTIGLANDTTISFPDDISGVLGLGFSRLATAESGSNATSFFTNLIHSNNLSYPIFGIGLASAYDASIVSNISEVAWSRVVQFPPFIGETNVTRSSYLHWAVVLDAISIGNHRIKPLPTYPFALENRTAALIDVGFPGMYGPYADVARIFASIPDSRLVSDDGQWVVPCDTNARLTFIFSSRNFTMLPADYLIGPASGNPNLCLAWPKALPPSTDGIDWQLGGAFMRTVYSIFSLGVNGKEPPFVGFYPLRANLTENPAEEIDSPLSLLPTVQTTLPNFLLPTPTFTPSSYIFNTSVTAVVGGIVSSHLATSTYSPILEAQVTHVSAIPSIFPTPGYVTFVGTAANGLVFTTLSPVPEASVTLGVPPGWESSALYHSPPFVSCIVLLGVTIIRTIIY